MVRLKNERDFEFLRVSGKILGDILNELSKTADIGVKLSELDKLARSLIKKTEARPAFLGYKSESAQKPYPAVICTSVNDQVVHGLPNDYILKSGDVLKIDLGINYKGYFTDAAVTVGIGIITTEVKKLISATREALTNGIYASKSGDYLGNIGWIIEKTAEKFGLSVIDGLTGHGTGFELHEDPIVYNYGQKKQGIKLVPGLVLAIEPMFSVGASKTEQQSDGTFITSDGSLSAHFEQTVVITKNEPEILTPFLL